MARSTKLFTVCSLLMAFLFAYSASVQMNDPDWYLWFPLYAAASVVNLVSSRFSFKGIRQKAKLVLWLAISLFLKVVIEDHVYGLAGFFSFDMDKRVVREKLGSGFVAISMFLQSEAFSFPNDPIKRKKTELAREYGMALLVGVSYGLSILFFAFVEGDMKL